MRQTIPFEKKITFKTKIAEIVSISLDNDLMLKGEDLISGNFYISGTYKPFDTSTIDEKYSYKIPCEIAISDEYDTFDATVDIDDFHYEVIDDVLDVKIVVSIDNLKKKEIEETKKDIEINDEDELEEIELLDTSLERCYDEEQEKSMSFMDVKEKVKNESDTYLTYKVYVFKENDTIDKIIQKYDVTKEDLEDYNNLEEISVGSKIVIPSFND